MMKISKNSFLRMVIVAGVLAAFSGCARMPIRGEVVETKPDGVVTIFIKDAPAKSGDKVAFYRKPCRWAIGRSARRVCTQIHDGDGEIIAMTGSGFATVKLDANTLLHENSIAERYVSETRSF